VSATRRTQASSSIVELPASLLAPGLARAFSTEALAGCPPDMVDVALLLVSELVTNAVLHAMSAPTMRVDVDPAGVRFTVLDKSRTLAQLQTGSDQSAGGRGLQLVDALSASWGSSDTPTGKLTWFAL
jgi:anti-sigma regulatory factor (Ser/Thr protein kinase)